MADAWGGSWGDSWGDSWGSGAVTPDAPLIQVIGLPAMLRTSGYGPHWPKRRPEPEPERLPDEPELAPAFAQALAEDELFIFAAYLEG